MVIGAVRALKTGKHFMLNHQLRPLGAETGLFVLMDVGHIFAVRDFDWLVGGVPIRFSAIEHLRRKYGAYTNGDHENESELEN